MAYVTEVGKTYNVTGKNISACNDYIQPMAGDPHSRGESKIMAGFSLENTVITVIERTARIEEGYIDDNPGNFAPYEIVKITVEGKPGEYYAWVVYAGVVKVTPKVAENTKPATKPASQTEDPAPQPPAPQPGDAKVEVHAGQTVVLDIKIDANVSSKKDEIENATGSIEVELVDEEGKPYTKAEVVQLISENAIYTVTINSKTGKGYKDNLETGEYVMALYIGAINFSSGGDLPSKEGEGELALIANKLSKITIMNFKKIRCVGYAGRDGSDEKNKQLCLKRAVYIKEKLTSLQGRFKKDYIYTGIGGEFPAKNEEERKLNEKVTIYGILE